MSDPISNLLMEIDSKTKSSEPSEDLPTVDEALASASELIPQRQPTQVRDLLVSPALREFNRKFRRGQVQAQLIEQAVGLVRDLLVGRGIL